MRLLSPKADQVALGQPFYQIAADAYAEDVLQPVATDRLVVADGRQNGNVEFG